MNDTVTITVSKWEEYNPRKDLKSMPWFRIAADIGYSPTLYKLPVEAKWLWIFILSTCAKNISDTIEMEIDYLADYSDVSAENIKKYLTEFERRKLILLNPIESDRIRSSQIGVILDDQESVPKRRGENGEENREEESRGDESAVAPTPPDFFKDFIFKDCPKTKLTLWASKFDHDFILEELPKVKDWIKTKPPKKAFHVFFEDWLNRGYPSFQERKLKPKKVSPEIDANAKRFASEFYENVMKGTDEEPWLGNTNFDFEIMEKIGDLSKIRNSKPSQKQQIMSEIKAVILKAMDTG